MIEISNIGEVRFLALVLSLLAACGTFFIIVMIYAYTSRKCACGGKSEPFCNECGKFNINNQK